MVGLLLLRDLGEQLRGGREAQELCDNTKGKWSG
jgi:hypothetical protein